MFAEPLAGWRQATVREHEDQGRLGDRSGPAAGRPLRRRAERVIVGLRQPEHAHQGRVLRSVRARHGARQFVRRIDFCYTPKHGSWLNIAENELSSLTRQCVAGRRFGDARDAASGNQRLGQPTSTATQRGVDWQLKIDDARCKLKSVYPKIKL